MIQSSLLSCYESYIKQHCLCVVYGISCDDTSRIQCGISFNSTMFTGFYVDQHWIQISK